MLLAISLLAAALGGCHDNQEAALPTPVEPTETSVSHFCGMLLAEHPGPKGQIFLKGRKEPVWFSSVGETVAYTMLPEEPAEVLAIYVNDMGKAKSWARPESGTWVEARRAWFVLGSSLHESSGMSDTDREPIPFSDNAAAADFVQKHGGRIVQFSGIRQEDVLGGGVSAQSDTRHPDEFASALHEH
jgi:copper chaperone NosL